MEELYIGSIQLWALSWAPEGTLFCDGSILQISAYQALYSLIGDTYGGNVSQGTFALPDLRMKFPLGLCQPYGSQGFDLGDGGGAMNYTLTPNQIPQHVHPASFVGVPGPGGTVTVPSYHASGTLAATAQDGTTDTPGTSAVPAKAPDMSGLSVNDYIYGAPDGVTTMPVTVNIPQQSFYVGSSTPSGSVTVGPNQSAMQQVNNMPPYLILNYIICYQGIYPVRP